MIHSGYNVGPEEAHRAIRSASLLLRVLWVHEQQQILTAYGVSDILPKFKSQIRKIRL